MAFEYKLGWYRGYDFAPFRGVVFFYFIFPYSQPDRPGIS